MSGWSSWLSRILGKLLPRSRSGAAQPRSESPQSANYERSARPAESVPPAQFVRREMPAIGPYRVERVLGRGAMGAVFLGRDRDGGLAAIKTMALTQEFDADEVAEVRSRFFREAEAAARLCHPHIVRVLDTGEASGLAYIAMEYCDGGDLVPYTRPDGLLPPATVVEIIARVAEGLDYAHRNKIVHRDVKPANVMYDPESGRIKVADFGIARMTDSSRTKTGMVLGTPSYMSPEQLLGKKVDGRSDLFSLGVVLYQMLCGQLPFVDPSLAGLMFRITNAPPPDVRTLNPQLSEELVHVVERALSKNSEQRYPTGGEMAQDLWACRQQMSR